VKSSRERDLILVQELSQAPKLYQSLGAVEELLQMQFAEQRVEPRCLVQRGQEKLVVQTEEFHLLRTLGAEKDLLHELERPQALIQLALVKLLHL
jgi:hypothetical protein